LAKAGWIFQTFPLAKASGNLLSITFSSLPNFLFADFGCKIMLSAVVY
jgi:hypothetical protein